MTKVTLDMDTFKALASDTRLDILRTLDGKKMSLRDISTATKLNKATLHEHLVKLNEAGLVKKKEREGHKFVYYKLSWKGEGLLHPENTRIVVLFGSTFIALAVGIIQMIWYVKGTVMNFGNQVYLAGNEMFMDGGARVVTFEETMKYTPYGVNNIPTLPPNIPGVLRDFLISRGFYSSGSSLKLCDLEYAYDSSAPPYINGYLNEEGTRFFVNSHGVMNTFYQNPMFLYIAIACFTIFTIALCFSLWRYWGNKTPKL